MSWRALLRAEAPEWSKRALLQVVEVWQSSQVFEVGRWLLPFPSTVESLWQVKQPDEAPESGKRALRQGVEIWQAAEAFKKRR